MARNKREKWEIIPMPFDEFFSDPFERMRRLMNYPRRYIGTFMSSVPDIDMIDKGNELVIKVDLPGVDKKDVKVNVEKESVTVAAQTSKEKEDVGKNYYYSERSSSGYYRRIPLPVAIDSKKAKATFKDGLLEVVLPKAEPGESRELKIE
ncbi:MAG: Hsp20/alpha crystallin family protein [Candidatus Micrarchaeaceae archaeon]